MLLEIDEKSKNEILKLKELPNERVEGSWGALWLGIRTFFGFQVRVLWASWFRTEIVKLKELPNGGFETSRGALWLGMGTFFGFKFGYHGPLGAEPKS